MVHIKISSQISIFSTFYRKQTLKPTKGHDPYSPSTGWSFTPDGNIINSHLAGYGLTRTNTGPIVMKKLRKRNKNQVWVIKNKSKQWEKTTLNSYRRDALCWPIMPDGTLNQGKGFFKAFFVLKIISDSNVQEMELVYNNLVNDLFFR